MRLCLIAALLAASPALAADYTITLTQSEAQDALNGFDLATKAGGLPVAEKLLPLAKKLIDAGKVANAPKSEAPAK